MCVPSVANGLFIYSVNVRLVIEKKMWANTESPDLYLVGLKHWKLVKYNYTARFICIISLHICINILYFSSFWLTSLCMKDSRCIHFSTNDLISFLFYGWVILYFLNVPYLHPFFCWQTFRLLPDLGYYKQCRAGIEINV